MYIYEQMNKGPFSQVHVTFDPETEQLSTLNRVSALVTTEYFCSELKLSVIRVSFTQTTREIFQWLASIENRSKAGVLTQKTASSIALSTV